MRNLKNALIICLVTLLMANIAVAQTKKRPCKDARKEFRRLKKERYCIFPDALPLKNQLDNYYRTKMETDESGYPLYFDASAIVVAETVIEAKQMAYEVAKHELAGSIYSYYATFFTTPTPKVISNEMAREITMATAEIINLLADKIGQPITLVEVYKNVGKNVEVRIYVAYNIELAEKTAKGIIKSYKKLRLKFLE